MRFAATFLMLVVLLRWFASVEVVDQALKGPLCELIARWAGTVLSPFGNVVVQGAGLSFDDFRVIVVEACNGVLPITIYLAAVFAFPASWRARAWGVLIGLPGIFVLNLIRVVSLVVLGALWPALFEQVHIYVWQTLVVLLSMALWIFWAEQFVRPTAQLEART